MKDFFHKLENQRKMHDDSMQFILGHPLEEIDLKENIQLSIIFNVDSCV
jgi:hypothetical protein